MEPDLKHNYALLRSRRFLVAGLKERGTPVVGVRHRDGFVRGPSSRRVPETWAKFSYFSAQLHSGAFLILYQTRSYAVAKRSRDASCLYSFNTKRQAQSFLANRLSI